MATCNFTNLTITEIPEFAFVGLILRLELFELILEERLKPRWQRGIPGAFHNFGLMPRCGFAFDSFSLTTLIPILLPQKEFRPSSSFSCS